MSAAKDAKAERAAAATAAVFSVAELLEHIILDVVQDTTPHHALGLGATLSQLTQVSHDFRSIIYDSPKLARLATKTLRISGPVSTYDRLAWLFVEKLGLQLTGPMRYWPRKEHYRLTPRPARYSWLLCKTHERTARMRSFRGGAGNASASWRDIKLTSGAFEICIDIPDVACNYSPRSGRLLEEEGTKNVELEFDTEATLGVAFDKYCEIVDRSMEDREIASGLR
ncbi:uncharacterized protein CLAFUR5_07091 [Fulvia fulva]|uniref:Uncharacterized protein n=1 Tax=Passalora fulva TaxID=5499 RepID=A0A9Q8UQJ3_PASFU|nr:uncharacterized protein CLAFUR5_07091 [Fulvia fulva]KAK4623089.1 hypothetical protein CLAFUR0_06961 [Fulvia fulva]UJO18760.1 hypothetical protein CLAFUR5_07091 [Fulvia fulva]